MEKTFTFPPHTGIKVEFILWKFDSVDPGEYAALSIDGHIAWTRYLN